MGTAAAVLPSFGSPNISAGMGGDVQVCSGCKRHLGFNTSRCHLQPKAVSLPCNLGKHIWIVHSTGKGSPLVHHSSGRGSLDGKQRFRHFHSVLKMWLVCAVTPVRSLLHTLAPEVTQGFWKTAVERLGRRRRTQSEVLITAMPVPGKGVNNFHWVCAG